MPNRVRQYRQSMGWTLEALAAKVGSSKAYIWQLENKADPDPGVKLSMRLAKAFGISVEHLFRPADPD